MTISGVANAGYNGTFTVIAIPSSRSFQYTNPISGLPASGGGTVTSPRPEQRSPARPSRSAPPRRTAAPSARSSTIAGVGVGGYNGTFTITAVPTPRTFQYTAGASGLANSGGGSATCSRLPGPDRRDRLGADRRDGARVHEREHPGRDQLHRGVRRHGHRLRRGVHRLHGDLRRGLDRDRRAEHPARQLELRRLRRRVEETNHGGTNDSFTLNYNGNVSAPISTAPTTRQRAFSRP